MALVGAAPRLSLPGVARPYVHSPGSNPSGAAAYTAAAKDYYAPIIDYGPPLGNGGGGSGGSGSGAASPGPVDYKALLANDAMLGQALAGYNAQGLQNQGALKTAQQRALIQRGVIPNFSGVDAATAGDLNAAIDQTTRDLASQNTAAGTSTAATLRRAYDQAQQGSDASLAARGMLRSGAYGQHATENLQGYTTGTYQADQSLLDYLSGLYSGYQSQQQHLQQQGVQATNDALTRIIQQIQAGLLTGGTSGGGAAGGGGGGQTAPTITPQNVYYLPSRTSEPATVPATTILQRGRAYAA